VRELLVELRGRGVGVLLNSHLLGEVERVCDRVAIIDDGRVVESGRPSELVRPRGVEVETASGVRTLTDVGRDDVPRIVADLVAAGESVYGVRVLTSTLEEVYLDAVDGAAG
jgi:ABC-2 type transport system ATP-binding protein